MGDIVEGSPHNVQAAETRLLTKRKKRVLAEEEYVSSIEAIIERDFFPDLPYLKDRLARMQGQASLAPHSRHAGDLFSVVPYSSTFTGPTPAINGKQPVAETPIVAGTYSTEQAKDERTASSSFNAPTCPSLDVFLSQVTSEDNASFDELHREALLRKRQKVLHLLEFQNIDRQRIAGYIDWKFDAKNKLFYDSATTGDVQYTESELAARVHGPPKEIRHENTRLPVGFNHESTAELKPGLDYSIPGDKKTDPRPLLSTPTPIPGKNLTPIMTWGELAATPIRLDRTPGFTINAASERDVIGRKMARHARRSMQKRSARFTPASVRGTPNTLSAAGRKLFSAITKTPGTDLQLRASYARTPRRSSRNVVTPSLSKVKQEPAGDPDAKITDNLLD